jgi:putative pyruvate formate lyase activating enzyme
MSCYPAYLALARTGELKRRAAEALMGLAQCKCCPRRCQVSRVQDQTGVCQIGRWARVASYFPHLGEEDCLRGWHGSGTIFFSGCNLRCVFCQNYDISHGSQGPLVSAERLAEMMIELQNHGCHNINWVTPSHVVPQALEALALAAETGLRLPIVFNSSGYDSVEMLRLLDGVVDIYMPDFKFWDTAVAARLAKAGDYPAIARAALQEMHRQVGDLEVDDSGLARRGLLVRHLVMPNGLAGTDEIAHWLAQGLSPGTYVNVMDQYHPDGEVVSQGVSYQDIARAISTKEFREAMTQAGKAGLKRFDERDLRRR